MISKNDVKRVARTGSPLLHNGGTLTPEHVVRMTTSGDWIGTLYLLRDGAAQRIADYFNLRYRDLPEPDPDPQPSAGGVRALPPGRPRLALTA